MSTAQQVTASQESLKNVEYVQDSSYSAEKDAWHFQTDSSKKTEAIQWNVTRKPADDTVRAVTFSVMHTNK